jgi:hypothetical protein
VAKALETTVPVDARYTPAQVQDALNRMLPTLTFRQTPLRVEWYSPSYGRVYLAPFGYRQLKVGVMIEQDAGEGTRLHLRSDKLNTYRCPLAFRGEVRQLWETLVDRVSALS